MIAWLKSLFWPSPPPPHKIRGWGFKWDTCPFLLLGFIGGWPIYTDRPSPILIMTSQEKTVIVYLKPRMRVPEFSRN